ncbi:transposable element Tc1 transposase [Trichonephila clavipes]|nr:transposable element Tc1 transposase [Trichonephila clavipes]
MFERGRIIGLREDGFSYSEIKADVQRNSSTVMRVWKQWTNDDPKTRKTGSGRRKVTSARDDRHLLRMLVNDYTTSYRQLTERCSTATDVKSVFFQPQTLDHLEDNIRRVIADIRPQMLEKVIENWTSRLDYIRAIRGSPMPEIIFKM